MAGTVSPNSDWVGEGESRRHVVSYLAEFSAGKTFDDPPSTNDLKVPEIERPALVEIANQIRATAGTNELEIVQAVERFFAKNFHRCRLWILNYDRSCW